MSVDVGAPSADSEDGPAQLVLQAAVARRYYLAGQSKVAIADELSLSRFRVARLLERARATGLVRIEVEHPGGLDLELSTRLQDTFGLQHALVVQSTATDGPALRTELGTAAAALVREIVAPSDVLGLAWARAVSAMAAAMTGLAAVPVVQLTGSLAGLGDSDDSSVELVRSVGRVAGGPVYYFYAPMVVPDAATAAALRRQPEVASAFSRVSTVTKAVAGIGHWSPGNSTLHDATTPAERRRLRELRVCAEFCGVLVTAEGEPVRAELSDRLLAPTADQLRDLPELVALAYGVEKAPAVRAALRSGLVTSLVTHDVLARELLSVR